MGVKGDWLVRDREQIQQAHDTLLRVVEDDTLFDQCVNSSMQPAVKAYVDVLCWILKHDHNVKFPACLGTIELRMKQLLYGPRGAEHTERCH